MAQSLPPAIAACPLLTTAALAALLAGCAAPTDPPAPQAQPQPQAARPAERPATSARDGKQVGKASIYARRFEGQTMADGTPMSLQGDNAASKTLPLGSKARVKNLETGRSAVVTIQDRGPFVAGRIIDLSPATAAAIGLTSQEGIADVEVTPLSAAKPAETVGRSK